VSVEHYVALERGLAEIIGQFQDAPDLYLREADLHAATFAALERQEVLTARYATRDGRWTSLLHHDYPPLFAYEQGLSQGEPVRRGHYDLALLNPSFVRTYDLELVANSNPERAASLRALPQGERPMPLLAAINLKLIDECTPPVMGELEANFYALVRSEPDAERAYMAAFCRHWDLDGPMRQVLQALERWAANHRSISLVFLQSYRDDVGRVFGGRYLNLWSYTAPLMPLEPPYARL